MSWTPSLMVALWRLGCKRDWGVFNPIYTCFEALGHFDFDDS